MKLDKGFRLPEPTDNAIRWPSRKGNDEQIAIWNHASAAWLVPGIERAFGSPIELITRFGNDWYVVWIYRVPEAEK